jgi:UDP-N-acetylmuramoyl-L-alanyl-D-glutamate--2,6-diaminopimelate ligase
VHRAGEAGPGALFCAIPGLRADGHDFAAEAVARGAAALLVERPLDLPVPQALVPDARLATALAAAELAGRPSESVAVVGVTGTNGKTSVTHLVAQALNDAPDAGGAGASCGVLGTLGHGVPGRLAPALNTTPDPVTIHRRLREMQAARLGTAVLEVSSHGLTQDRVAGVRFAIAVLTNLSRDHLDYHESMTFYGAAKKRLFRAPGLRVAVLNLDDPFSMEVRAALRASTRVLGYRLAEKHSRGHDSVIGSRLRLGPHGLSLSVSTPWGEGEFESTLIGRFNAYNLLAALATLLELGLPLAEALGRLGRALPPPGRLECFGGERGRPLVVVDYAHTPDGLEQALDALRPGYRGRLTCIFGCGGERDAGKRPLMGAVAETLADVVVVTTDNPRGEDPDQINGAILSGMRQPERAHLEPDRERAIAWALAHAGEGDVVLVAGKGHESYQEVGGVRQPYSDREVVQRLFLEGAA